MYIYIYTTKYDYIKSFFPETPVCRVRKFALRGREWCRSRPRLTGEAGHGARAPWPPHLCRRSFGAYELMDLEFFLSPLWI